MKLQLRYLRSEVSWVNKDEVINEIILKPASTRVMHKWGLFICFDLKRKSRNILKFLGQALSPTLLFFLNYALSANGAL